MAYNEKEKVDDFTKPSRQNRGGKKKRSQENSERAPKDVYKRQRISMNDVVRTLDDEDEDVDGNY